MPVRAERKKQEISAACRKILAEWEFLRIFVRKKDVEQYFIPLIIEFQDGNLLTGTGD